MMLKNSNKFYKNLICISLVINFMNIQCSEGRFHSSEEDGRAKNCTTNKDCNIVTEICDLFSYECICNIYSMTNRLSDECDLCPLDDSPCNGCCGKPYLDCIDNFCQVCVDDRGNYVCGSNGELFATASQIALSIAMILGIMILISLLYRICTKPRYLSAANRPQISLARNSLARISLSSIQIRVLARLQNRPPLYETQHDYDFRQRELRENEPQCENISNLFADPPPLYDGTSAVLDTDILPPPYAIAIISTDNFQNGIINTNFIHDNEINDGITTTPRTEQILVVTTTEQNSGNQIKNCTETILDNSKDDCNKNLHI